MPNRCCAPGCKSGYYPGKDDPGISMHKFPGENSSLFQGKN